MPKTIISANFAYSTAEAHDGERVIDELDLNALYKLTDGVPTNERESEMAALKTIEAGEYTIQGQNVFRSEHTERGLADYGAQVTSFSVGMSLGDWTRRGPFDGTPGGLSVAESQAQYMTAQIHKLIQAKLNADQNAEIDIDLSGISRGAVSASILARNLQALYGDDSRVRCSVALGDPVPGGPRRVNNRMGAFYDCAKDGAAQPVFVEALKQAGMTSVPPGRKRNENERRSFSDVTVIYSARQTGV